MKRYIAAAVLMMLLLPFAAEAVAKDYKSLFNTGNQSYKNRDYAAASRELLLAREAARTAWDDYAVTIRLANIFFQQKKYPEAIVELKRALASKCCYGKERMRYNAMYARILQKQNKLSEALSSVEAALQIKAQKAFITEYTNVELLKAQLLLELGEYRKLQDFLRTVKLEKHYSPMMHAQYNYLAGCAAAKAGDLAAAETYFKKNLKLNGKYFTQESKRRLNKIAGQRGKPAVKGANLLPDGSFEYSTGGAWNRMMLPAYPLNSYLKEDCKWSIDTATAYHGKRSLRSNGVEPLLLMCEGEGSEMTFSIYLKGATSQAEVMIELYGYTRFQPTKIAAKKFKLSDRWQRCTVPLRRKWFSVDKEAVPLEIYIKPLNNTTVWADAAQYEKGDLTGFSEYENKLISAEAGKKEIAERSISRTQPVKAQKSKKMPVKGIFSVKYPVAAANVPVTVAIPFAEGEWFGDGSVEVEALTDGKRYPAQGTVTGRWVKDQSVRVLCVDFQADLTGKVDKFKLHFSPEKPAPAPRCTIPELTLRAEAMDGSSFIGKEVERQTVHSGAVFTDEVRKGLLSNAEGKVLAGYSLHLRSYHRSKTLKITSNILNFAPHAIAIRAAELEIDTGKSGKAADYLQQFSNMHQKFLLKPDGSYGKVSANGGTLLVREASLRHPVKLAVDKAGKFTGYLWSNDHKPLFLSRRMNLNREFIFTPATDKVQGHGYRAAALAAPEDVDKSNLLLMPLGGVDEKSHPFAIKNFNVIKEKLVITPAAIFSNPKKKYHGFFNYGDIYGDRGWSNQESYMDYSGICFALALHDLEVLDNAFTRAVHYRDVDIVDGTASYHSPAHVSGPTYEYSHSWPQGVMLHYLLTGDTRSKEVIDRVIERYMATPVEYKYITDSRSLGRFLLGLADFYILTGDEKIKDRFYVQLARAEKENLTDKFRDQTIFHWHGRCDPFHVWYGCYALYQLYQATGDEKLLKSFKREMEASLNMDFFRHDLNELWFGVPMEKAWPIQLGYHSHHRGSLFYPMMRFYAEKFNRPDYLKIAQLAAYAQFLRGDSNSEPMDIFRTSVLKTGDEKSLLNEAVELVYSAAPGKGKVINGDFSASNKWFSKWHIPAGRQMSYDDVMESWPLPEVKDVKKITAEYQKIKHLISPWRSYARKYAYMDSKVYHDAPPSLRLTSQGSTTFEHAPVVIAPGSWKFTAAFKLDDNFHPAQSNFSFCYTEEKEKTRVYRIKFDTLTDPAKCYVFHGLPILEDVSARIFYSDKKSWRKIEFTFRNKRRGIITLKGFLRIRSSKTPANMWLDDVKLERIK